MHCNSAFIGKGGVAILYKRLLMFSVQEVNCYNTSHIIGIKLDDHRCNVYYIIDLYMHAENNIDVYKQELDTLENLHNYYFTCGKVIIAGDVNGSLLDTCNTTPTKGYLLSQNTTRPFS
jgi:hypothetical protein